MINDRQIEAAAKTLYEGDFDVDKFPWEEETEDGRDAYRRLARAALEAADAVTDREAEEQRP